MGSARGMQMIADYFGAELAKVEKHVAVRHRLKGNAPWNGRTVNSFHNMAVKAVADNLIIEARSEDGVIEAIRVRNKKYMELCGILSGRGHMKRTIFNS